MNNDAKVKMSLFASRVSFWFLWVSHCTGAYINVR